MYRIKKYIRKHEKIMRILSFIYRLLGMNVIRGLRGVRIIQRGVFARRMKIYNRGVNNVVEMGLGCRVHNCSIRFFGDNNKLIIKQDCVCKGMDIWVSDGGVILIGNNTHFVGKIHLACTEGCKIEIGERCLFSDDITFRTGDSHVIIDLSGNRINIPQNIKVDDHTWFGQQVVVLKGASIGKDSIIGTRSLITGKKFPDNVVIAGSPAKVIKDNVMWRPE